jgi:hypothetical protein
VAEYGELVDRQVAFARKFRVRAQGLALVVHVTEADDAFLRVPRAGWVHVGKWEEYRLLPPLDQVRAMKEAFSRRELIATRETH